jgi:hypothetical protein
LRPIHEEPPLISPTQDTVGKSRLTHNSYDGVPARNLWKTPFRPCQKRPGSVRWGMELLFHWVQTTRAMICP